MLTPDPAERVDCKDVCTDCSVLTWPLVVLLSGIASALVAAQAQDSSTTSGQVSTEQSVQTSLQSTLSAGSGVSMDTEMSLMITLQNAYGANAKVITAAQAMFT